MEVIGYVNYITTNIFAIFLRRAYLFEWCKLLLFCNLSIHLALCQVHISYILWGRNPKFGVWMHIWKTNFGFCISQLCMLVLTG